MSTPAPSERVGPYELIELIGKGGMGEVWRARDPRLGRDVAIKVSKEQFSERFEHEARAIASLNHPNVCTLHDVGPNYLVMELVDGRPLKGPLPIPELLRYALQILDALETAHAKGIVHRDLKPANILLTASGVKLLDFGVAGRIRALPGPEDETQKTVGLTRPGEVMGTPAYMAPEQWAGKPADPRTDIYAFGCIVYELLTGERAGPQRNALKPGAIEAVVRKCLATNPEDRWQSAAEVRAAIEKSVREPVSKYLLVAAAAAVVAVATTGASWFWLRQRQPPPPHSAMTVMIADFTNRTGEPVFDGTLESTLKLALEGAGFISAWDRGQLRALGVPPADRLDEAGATKIAVSQGLGVVLSGSIQSREAGYDLSFKAVQAVTGRTLAHSEVRASTRDQVLSALAKGAVAVRRQLGDTTSEDAQRFAVETLTTQSLESVHAYAKAMESLSDGKQEEAFQNFSRAVEIDPNFGIAYTGMAMAARNADRHSNAEKYIAEALRHIDRMTERERYRTRGAFYLITGDFRKCADEYAQLVARFSSDAAAFNNLGVCYSWLRNIPKANEAMERAAEILPHRPLYRFNHALYQVYAGNFQTAEAEVEAALQINATYPQGFLTLAYAQLGQNQLNRARSTYERLAKTGAPGASMAAAGLADLATYEGRYRETVQILEKGASEDLAAGRKDAAAEKFCSLSYVEGLRNQGGLAMVAADRALAISDKVKTRFLAARIFVEFGEAAKARMLASRLSQEIRAEPQAYAKYIEGEIALRSADAPSAVRLLMEGNALLDTWLGHFELGRAYLAIRALPEADSELDRCIKRRGEAMELFMDDIPTYSYFPAVYYYLGRVRQELKSSGYGDWYRKYLEIRGRAGEDLLLADVRRGTQ
jgi:tetratricopeptide (TPR) repeat protein/predicted Ser/Thr protein kinase